MASLLLVISLITTLVSTSLVYTTKQTVQSLTPILGAGFTIVPAAASAGGFTIGSAIVSGTASRIVYEDSSNLIAESANLTFNGATLTALNASTTGMLTVGGGFISSASSTVAGPLQIAGPIQASSSVSIERTLAITGTTGTSTIASGQGFTVGSTQFVVNQGSGNVGIGIANPARRVDIQSTAVEYFEGLRVLQTGDGAAAASVNVESDDSDGTLTAYDSGDAWYPSAVVVAAWDEGNALTLKAKNSFIRFDSDNNAERMRMTAVGNFGIGTTSPTSLLSLSSTGTTTIHMGTAQQTDQGSCIQMYQPNGVAARVYVNNSGVLVGEAGSCNEN